MDSTRMPGEGFPFGEAWFLRRGYKGRGKQRDKQDESHRDSVFMMTSPEEIGCVSDLDGSI